MRILNEFNAADRGTFEEFQGFYNDNPNAVDKYSGLSLLSTCASGFKLPDERFRIANKLVADGADVSFIDSKYKRTALHYLFFVDHPRPVEYLLAMAELLIGAGTDVNALDKFSSIALRYAIANTKGTTEELAPVYRLLLEAGSDYHHIDVFGKSCLDYAEELNWRTGFLDIVKEYEHGK